jgi:hypothetical protein
MISPARRIAAAGALAAALFVAPLASAQYTNDPFFDWTVLQSQAIGLERAALRLRIVQAVEPPYDADFAEIVENLTGPDFQRFGATLAAADKNFADDLYEVLDAIAEGVEEGEDISDLVPVGLDMLATAYDMVIPPEIRALPAFKGGLLAQLLLGDGGVSEGLAEAFDEEWEFANGWASAQRAKELWAEIESLATADQALEINDAIAEIDAIYTSAEPPETLAGVYPEEAETPAQRIVGFLEVVLDSALYSGRDQVRLLTHLIDVAAPACQSYEAGEDGLGREVMYAVFDHYAGETTGLGALIGLFAPEVNDVAMAALANLVIVEGNGDEDEDSASGSASGGGEEVVEMDAAEACHALVGAFGEARSVLGG